METFHIHINGIVQGVGFRPMVYQLAQERKLVGYIKNGSDGVHIFFNATQDEAKWFYDAIISNAPAQAKIVSSWLKPTAAELWEDFSILVAEDDHKKQVLISPDRALCDSCRKELLDPRNSRYRYPFITCTHCGPRYSILSGLPYERHSTSMQPFVMCPNCQAEYLDVLDRRFYSQTNSCVECGVQMRLYENPSSVLSDQTREILGHIKEALHQGKILAIKGLGGYLLFCSAENPVSIQLLRKRKHRPQKPFAVLYPGLERAREDFEINETEENLLKTAASPIVLLYPKKEKQDFLPMQDIAPGLKRLGILIPYTPLLELIAGDYGKPLIATSANIAGSPILYKDEDALDFLFDIADYVISSNREILIPQDDSVVQVSRHFQQPIIGRRSRGYAPSYLSYKPKSLACILCTGALLKSSFSVAVNGNIFVSQFLGSGENYESQQIYKNTLRHFLDLYETRPQQIVTDMHPGYFSHQYARELAGSWGVELKYVQHHEAHFAAVLAENNLIDTQSPVLGVIWDGTGLGRDGNNWGGEFFKYENKGMLRCYHFDYFPSIAGDKMAQEPRIAALCVSQEVWPSPDIIQKKFSSIAWNNYQSLIQTTGIFNSSVGRIFDAVASLLNLCDKQTYEGEAAMYLQTLAEDYIGKHGFEMEECYFKEGAHFYRIPTATLIQGICMDIQKCKGIDFIAAKFHYSLVKLVGMLAKNLQVKKICFSGGVFQNALLVDWLLKEYQAGYDLYFHQQLSPNDENISFGQLVYCDNNLKSIDPLEGVQLSQSSAFTETMHT